MTTTERVVIPIPDVAHMTGLTVREVKARLYGSTGLPHVRYGRVIKGMTRPQVDALVATLTYRPTPVAADKPADEVEEYRTRVTNRLARRGLLRSA